MDQLFGMWQITCQNSSKDYIMLGFWNFVRDIFDGSTHVPDHGSIRAVFMTVNVAPQTIKWCFVIIVMPCTDLNVYHHHCQKYQQKRGIVLTADQS